MIIGQTLMGTGVGAMPYGEWFARQGDSLIASWEVLNRSRDVIITLAVETKNMSDLDSAAMEVANTAAVGLGPAAILATGCLELVRYTYDIKPEGEWAHVRDLPPSWILN